MPLISYEDAVNAVCDLCDELKTENPHIDAIMDALGALPPEEVPVRYSDMSDEDFENWLRSHGICNPCINDSIMCSVVPSLIDAAIEEVLPAQPDEKLEKCRFEYINACRIVTFHTPDTTKKDISDAYAVIKALQPIFGDVPFAKEKRGDTGGTD